MEENSSKHSRHLLSSVEKGLGCGVQAFYSCKERGLLFITVRGLLTVVASRVVEYEF